MNNDLIDFRSYLECKPHLFQKDEIIAEKISEELKKRNGTKQIRILDVGSGEASLLEKICNNLFKIGDYTNQKQIIIEAIEPSQAGQQFIKDVKKRLDKKGITVNLYGEKIEEYLKRDDKPFNFIISIHSFYFIEKSKWDELTLNLVKRLDKEGELLIELVSKESDIYKLYDEIGIGNLKLGKRYESCGWYYFAEDFEHVLKSKAFNYKTNRIKSKISFDTNTIEMDRLLFKNNKMVECKLVNFLAFMFRIQPSDLINVGYNHLIQILTKDQVQFNSYDFLYFIRNYI